MRLSIFVVSATRSPGAQYNFAMTRAPKSASAILIRRISKDNLAELDQIRQFFRNFAAGLSVDLSYQSFDEEMATLPGEYVAPRGGLFFAEDGQGAGFGCVGIRPFSDTVCVMKRLYVEPGARGLGVGKQLALTAIRAARAAGYQRLMVDTLPAMRIAVRMYRDLGFLEAPAYYTTPIEGTQFLVLDLGNWKENAGSDENLLHLFDFNRAWAKRMREVDGDYFEKLSQLQAPEYLWIGCSDSRVPANQIVGLLPGEVFVHRNVGNVVVHTDLNCLSVLQFATEVLKVRHIMVTGHYGCGGVQAAFNRDRVGLADLWLRHIQDVHTKHIARVDALPPERRADQLCELNVLEQALNVCHSMVVQDAWKRGQSLTVHGWIYGLKDGLMRDLGFTVGRPEDIVERYEQSLARLL
jgi:carbonic anhydrase